MPASVHGGSAALEAGSALEKPAAVRRGRLLLRRETKQRGGKTAVIVTGFETIADLRAGEIEAIARELKQSLACGGTVEENSIVLQGDGPARVAELLRARGFRVGGVTA